MWYDHGTQEKPQEREVVSLYVKSRVSQADMGQASWGDGPRQECSRHSGQAPAGHQQAGGQLRVRT